jgi:hypothetical protein
MPIWLITGKTARKESILLWTFLNLSACLLAVKKR